MGDGGPNERWVMADTVSTLNALKVKKELAEYEHLVRSVPQGEQPGAKCANG